MLFRHLFLAVLVLCAAPVVALAQSDKDASSMLNLELNAIQDVGEGCRLTFLVRNETGFTVEKAVFETVIFDTTGGAVILSLFDFRQLPLDRPRVRQFDLPEMPCKTVNQVLINGASSCVVKGAESDLCHDALTLNSRLAVELLG